MRIICFLCASLCFFISLSAFKNPTRLSSNIHRILFSPAEEIKKQEQEDIKFYQKAELKNGYPFIQVGSAYQLNFAAINLMKIGAPDSSVAWLKRFLLKNNKATEAELESYDYSNLKSICQTKMEAQQQNLSNDKSLNCKFPNGKTYNYSKKDDKLIKVAKDALLQKYPGTKILDMAVSDDDWFIYKHSSGMIKGKNRLVAVCCKLPNEWALRVDFIRLDCNYSGAGGYTEPKADKVLNVDGLRFVKE